jgi:hypothetical protein
MHDADVRPAHDVAAFLTTAADVRLLVATATPESLHLEYKRKQEAWKPGLSKDDARAIAEAVCAFANSDGGTLVMGVRSERRDGEDVAAEIVELANAERLAAEARTMVTLNVSPQVVGVRVQAIVTSESGAGVLVVQVPPSDARPHMCTAPKVHRYYRRSFTGNEIMTPGEIRDQILAVREATLTPVVDVAEGGSMTRYPGYVAVEASIRIRLRNTGSRLCRDPFMRAAADCTLGSHMFGFDSRLGAWKTDYSPGMMIHVGDEAPAMMLRYLARLDTAPFLIPEEMTVERLLSAATILPLADFHSELSYMGDGVPAIGLTITYGAENASVRSEQVVLSRDALARGVLKGLRSALQQMFVTTPGGWRDDVFARL